MRTEELEPALKALEASTGIRGRREGVRLELVWQGRPHWFSPERRAVVRPPHVPLLRERLGALLVTRHVSAPLADQLRGCGVNFIDEAGNAYLETDSWMVLVTGRALSPGPTERAAVSRAMWQVAYVLLRGGSDVRTVRELGQMAGVSHGSAAHALRLFEQRGWLDASRALCDPHGFLRAWDFGYQDRLLPALDLGRAAIPAARSLQTWSEAVESQLGPEGLLGGEVAAQRMGTDIVAITATLHVPRWDDELMRRFHLVPDQDGPVSIRRTFGAPARGALVDPLLVRAELLSVDDARVDAACDELRQRIERRWAR